MQSKCNNFQRERVDVFQVGKNDNNLTKGKYHGVNKNKVIIIITAPIKYGANHAQFYGITLSVFALINEESITITSLYAQKSTIEETVITFCFSRPLIATSSETLPTKV